MGLSELLVIMVLGVLGVSCAAQEETEFPSLLSALGSKVALADDYYDDDDGETNEPQASAAPCCYPLVWQGRSVHELAVSGHGSRGHGHRGKSGPMLSRSVDQFYIDGARQRLAGHKMEFSHHHGKFSWNISWIFSISSNRTGDYYIFDQSAQKCQHRVVRNVAWHRQCIPSNATLRDTFSLGPVGGLNVQAWTFGGRSRSAPEIEGDKRQYPRPRVFFGASILIVPGSCVPVLIKEHGFVVRGIDQQHEELSRQANIDDTGLFDRDDSNYENYVQ